MPITAIWVPLQCKSTKTPLVCYCLPLAYHCLSRFGVARLALVAPLRIIGAPQMYCALSVQRRLPGYATLFDSCHSRCWLHIVWLLPLADCSAFHSRLGEHRDLGRVGLAECPYGPAWLNETMAVAAYTLSFASLCLPVYLSIWWLMGSPVHTLFPLLWSVACGVWRVVYDVARTLGRKNLPATCARVCVSGPFLDKNPRI